MYVAVVHNVFVDEKQTNERKASSDDTIAGFKTLPLQTRKRKGNKIGTLTYRFDKCGGSRQDKCVVKMMLASMQYPHFNVCCEIEK